ncbi:cisplatin damage response ATP-dependent DNA ligase [Lichenihabitans sp. Uapishka_5]|uniref:cisplatin damage response ATP-dependent DNA ligase n=1 Tax=Lichenihabitans sp. Uapishka_5 TaxID=3037302 RepID=UPI0029E7EE22|nr:cisplatin damage response ATP-dependent DNA ligase [Lichenihabitans sp. Uapishka_5]MDX7951504.1 cisplatin damage response ATP-dependent DNA ligase [Lichenihabitans sp. Uapishka_5]
MKAFAALFDRLSFEPSRNGKLRLMTAFFRDTPDPERGYALAALTDSLKFQHAKPALVRALLEERVDPVLFNLSYHFVGDLSETVALLWPKPDNPGEPPLLSTVVQTLATTSRAAFPRQLALWLDALDEIGRWALLKLITGSLRIGVSARLAKTAAAAMGGREANEVEEVWHGLPIPYGPLFAWLENTGPRPDTIDPAPFRPAMLAHPLEERDAASLDPADFIGEWKWDGIRVQAIAGVDPDGHRVVKLYSRAGEDVSASFPDLLDSLLLPRFGTTAVDGELLVMRDGLVQPFGALQQRLNRKSVSVKAMAEFPVHLRAYDLLAQDGEDLRTLPFTERRARLERFVMGLDDPKVDLSPTVPFASWDDLAASRADPAGAGAGADAEAIEGLMLKRRDSPYVPGRPKGLWFKWKRNPFNVDAVLMYAQRGHGKRASFYSDYTFGVWRGEPGEGQLVPVGKAYSGFTDQELAKLDRYVRTNTISRFGPVREVEHTAEKGLVLEILFEGLNRSSRHKSGVAMRFPRVARIRWEKPTREADRIETLEAMLEPK